MRLLIDGLPFTSEGCSKAKSILIGKFGKSTGITAAHIQCISALSVIQNSHPNRIHGFYEKLMIGVQALVNHEQVEINMYVRLTFDKLPGIRVELVRIDDNWQQCAFSEFVGA